MWTFLIADVIAVRCCCVVAVLFLNGRLLSVCYSWNLDNMRASNTNIFWFICRPVRYFIFLQILCIRPMPIAIFKLPALVLNASELSGVCVLFLLLVRYVPNVAKEEFWDQCKKYEYWRPTTDLRVHSRILGKFQMAITLQRVVRSPSCLVLGWGIRGRRIQRRHFRLNQIQDGSRRRFWKTSNGRISATYYPIHSMYVRRPYFASLIYNDGDSKLIS